MESSNQNKIHHSVIIEGDVVLGKNNIIHPYSVLIGPLVIGDNNVIGPHAVIGTPGQDTRNPRYDSKFKRVVIGSNSIIREFTSINKAVHAEETVLNDGLYLMNNAHVSHDAILEKGVVLAISAKLAGLVTVLENATIAMDASIHQKCVIGQYAIAGQGAAVVKNIMPFSRYVPNKPISINSYAIEKFKLQAHEHEISNYVIHNMKPKNDFLLKTIDHFEKLHILSKKEIYK